MLRLALLVFTLGVCRAVLENTCDLDSRLGELELKINLIANNVNLLAEYRGLLSTTPGQVDPVAFSAYLDHDIIASANLYTIVYNQVYVNEGNAYNNETGVFTSPKDGLYDFSFFVGQRDAKNLITHLQVNDVSVATACADGTTTNKDIQGGNRVLIRLVAGDVVKVVIQNESNHVDGDNGKRSTFSGLFVSA